MLTGRVKFFLDAKNHGFIEPHDGGKDVMFHRSALQGVQTIKEGQWVTFSDVIENPRGPKALKVELCAPKKPRPAREDVKPISEYEGWHGTQ